MSARDIEPPGPPRAAEPPPLPSAAHAGTELASAEELPAAETVAETLAFEALETSVPADPGAAEEEPGASVAEPPAVPVDVPPKAATWEEKEAGEWFPEGLATHAEILANYHYEDHFEREAAALPGWKILAATRRGRLHAHRGGHREDALGFGGGRHCTVLCVADGAGAYQYSRIGAEFTCRMVVASLEKICDENAAAWAELDRDALTKRVAEAMLAATKTAIDGLEELARQTASLPKDFRCTLLTAVLYLGTRARVALTSQVGDGFFAGLNRDGQARRYGISDSGTYSGQVTCFVPDAEALNHAARIRSLEVDDLEALMLCTDGIEDPFYPLEKNAAAIFRQLYDGDAEVLPGFDANGLSGPVIGEAAVRERLAQWLAFEKKGENDDRTILILHRDPKRCSRVQ